MITPLQILLIVLVCTLLNWDSMHIQIFYKGIGEMVLLGFIVGLIMGDYQMGLLVGGTMQLMNLGLAGYGGASIPNYRIGTAVGTAFAVATGGGLDTALVIGIPAATLGVQIDVFSKMIGSYVLHAAQKAAEEQKFKKMNRIIFWGNLFLGRITFTSTYPVLIMLVLGSACINSILGFIPAWLIDGLKTVGNILPAVGMAILLKYLPAKKYFVYLILGFVLVVYFGLSILPVAIVGGIIAYVIYGGLQKETSGNVITGGGIGDE
ncbi:PTS N-acetylgalactosamine transporter subunit IIA [Clostridium sp. chh4-2]|uniref:PTS mannose/fructose/sorbose/N-acetylgalactosamine transporter subunit IIC n=1 Tax=Clostridium sp. chh4-2 TaxID=2067550 RepID=UPI000CCF8022|nr:PTS sugar transporter subunit IIC [Clostridium sp. chh4-2]PNV63563.1 PTS N-acetylgalactosamine transporter subunit IIA [Clostridium sp. chh4-2]